MPQHYKFYVSAVSGQCQSFVSNSEQFENNFPISFFFFLCGSGYTLLRNPHHNKGLAFNEYERDAHYLRGLLPPSVVDQELQVD